MSKSLLDLIEEHGIDLQHEGEILRAYCPFHNDTGRPNFTVYPETDSWFCFACNEGGNAALFLSKIEGISYGEAVRQLKGLVAEVDELQQKIDGLRVPDEPLSFNLECNFLVSRYCRDLVFKQPEKLNLVRDFLRKFDLKLLVPVNLEKMKQILQEMKEL